MGIPAEAAALLHRDALDEPDLADSFSATQCPALALRIHAALDNCRCSRPMLDDLVVGTFRMRNLYRVNAIGQFYIQYRLLSDACD